MSLVARTLEENNIATVVFGSAKDILEYCGAPRFVFSDFPLGNPCGKPNDHHSQSRIFKTALEILQVNEQVNARVTSSETWADQFNWKKNFMYVGPDNLTKLKAKGQQRRAEQAALRARLLAARNA